MTIARTTLLALAAFGTAVLVAACPVADEQIIKKTAIEHGEAVFKDPKVSGTTFNEMSCATCHEIHAGDNPKLRFSGAPLAGVLERPTYWGGQTDTLLESINACLYYFMLANEPWSGQEEDAKALYAYLESLEPEAEVAEKAPQSFTIGAVADVAPGDASRGKAVYAQACATCHGAKTTGASKLVKRAPTLPEQTLQAHPSPMYSDADRRLIFIEKTRHGGFLGYGGQMSPVSEETVSDQDLSDLLTYLGVPGGQ